VAAGSTSVLWGKGRWVLQKISLEQCLPEMSLTAAEGSRRREFHTSRRTDISVLGCWSVAECPAQYRTGRWNDWNSQIH